MDSMTGFGEAEKKTSVGVIRAEIKTLNHKFKDLVFNLPSGLSSLEQSLRKELERIKRGRVIFSLQIFPGIKVEREPVKVPDEIINFIAETIKTNIRELEGALIRIVAYSLLEEKSISLELAREVLKDTLKETVKSISIDLIQKKVTEDFNLNLLEIKTKKRNRNIVFVRQIAMYLCRELTNFSLPEIGEYFGGMDHTTVLYAYNKIKDLIDKNRDFKKRVDRIIELIKQ